MEKPDGGPAFPQSLAADGLGGLNISYNCVDGAGMTLRDYFAGQALALGGEYFYGADGTKPDRVAAIAYAIADAMIAGRDK